VLLPNADRAIVPEAKVRDYLLSNAHPVGRFKAVFFIALGYSAENWEVLRDALLALAATYQATPGHVSPFGQKFEVRAILARSSGRRAQVVTVWMVPTGQNLAHFITAFPA
jgi:hypothetical protein